MSPAARDRRGVVLVLVLLVLVAVVTLTLSLARDAKTEVAVGGQAADAARLRALVASAVARAKAEVRRDADAGDTLFAPWRDDEAAFRGASLGAGRFWLLCAEPDPGDGREVRWGVRDEASRLNVNAATRDQLLALPGITEEAVDGILDWRDSDDDVRELGAEGSYYGSLEPAYRAKNTSFESIEELLRVRGVDAALLYGEDRNRNGLLDPGEDDADGSFPPDDADGDLDRGIADYLTVFSRQLDRTADDRPRLVWDQASPEELDERLEEAGLDAAVRQQLVQMKGGGPGGDGPGGGPGGPGVPVSSRGQLLVSEADEEDAAIIFEELTVQDSDFVSGRVNVNTAPRAVLAGLPGLETEDVDAILERRLDASSGLGTPAWLLRAIPREKLQTIADLVTTRSGQFRVHAVALLDDRPRFRRVEVLIDRTYAPVRTLWSRDLTPLGFPFPDERGEGLP